MSTFKNVITSHCATLGWNIAELQEDKACLNFEMDSGRTQSIYILNYNSVLEFSVPSSAIFETPDDIPHFLSTTLLSKNAEYKIGAWAMEQVGDKFVYSIMFNEHINAIDTGGFKNIVMFLLAECDGFDGFLIELSAYLADNPGASSQSASFDWGQVLQVGAETLVRTFVRDEVDDWFNRRR